MLDNPIGRMLLVVLNTAISGSVSLLIFLVIEITAPTIMKFAVLGIIGLTAGFTTRRLLPNSYGFLKLLVALIAVIVSLLMLNVYSQGFIGIDLLPRAEGGPEWDHLTQFGVGAFTAWLTLVAWKNKKPRVSTSDPEEATGLRILPTRVGDWWNRVNIRVRDSLSRSRVNLRSASSVNGRSGRFQIRARRKTKAFSLIRRQQQVQLSTVEEHRCPYCLEEVKADDPRGVEICPICHTHHHADCWAVTGTCQVPHVQE